MWRLNVAKDKIGNVLFQLSDIEILVRDVTSDQPWGPTMSEYEKLQEMSYSSDRLPALMKAIFDRITSPSSSRINVYKSLLIIDDLVLNGSERVTGNVKLNSFILESLVSRDYSDNPSEKDKQSNVQRSKKILELVFNDKQLKKEREKAREWKERKAAGEFRPVGKHNFYESKYESFSSKGRYRNYEERQNETPNIPQLVNDSPEVSNDVLRTIDEKLKKYKINHKNNETPIQKVTNASNQPIRINVSALKSKNERSDNFKQKEPQPIDVKQTEQQNTEPERPLIDFGFQKSFNDTSIVDGGDSLFCNSKTGANSSGQDDFDFLGTFNRTEASQNRSFLNCESNYNQNYGQKQQSSEYYSPNPSGFQGFQGFQESLSYTPLQGPISGFDSPFVQPQMKASGLSTFSQQEIKKEKKSLDLDDLLAENINNLQTQLTSPTSQTPSNTYGTDDRGSMLKHFG